MTLELRRIVLFTKNMAAMRDFYGRVLGLEEIPGDLVQFRAGGCNIALHNGTSEVGKRPPKPVFYAADVGAARALLVARGATRMGKLSESPELARCDGRDPDGNMFGLSNRA